MAGVDRIITVGASMGGVEALQRLVAPLPIDFPAAICVVLHISPDAPSRLPEILSRAGKLLAQHPREHEPLVAGRIYIAPPDQHLRVDREGVKLSHAAKQNGHRPAVDVLLRSAAAAFHERAIGVILTGALDDGTAGLHAIQRAGGITIVQDPTDAHCPEMPASAMRNVKIDHIAALDEIGPLLMRLVAEPPPRAGSSPPEQGTRGEPAFSCPACGGVLRLEGDDLAAQFACKVGHVYSPLGLVADQRERLESGLWTALRTLEESSELSRRLALRSAEQGHALRQTRFEERARSTEEQAKLIRAALHLHERSSELNTADAPEPIVRQARVPEG
jgi:two-component system chemotaxis response regulator CheB